MSTRSTTHFTYGKEKPQAIIYRHSDGYPSGAGVDLKLFFSECAKLHDPRFTDPSYLAAKYVVFLADRFNTKFNFKTGKQEKPESKLDFISVGVTSEDPGDIEYRYIVDCEHLVDGFPGLKCFKVRTGEEVEIPGRDEGTLG